MLFGKIFIAWGLFFFWGVWLADRYDLFEKSSRKIVVLGTASILSFFIYFWPIYQEVRHLGATIRVYFLLGGLLSQFIAATTLLILFYRIDQIHVSNRFMGRLLGYMGNSGKDTYGIYLSHVLFIVLYEALWRAIGFPYIYWPKVISILLLTWVSSQLLVRICRYPKLRLFNRLLFGGR
jgi:hypothetical protein